MSVTVAMYDKSLQHIGARLDALNLDITVQTFGQDGKFTLDGVAVAPADLDIDYFWLSAHINDDDFREGAFSTALACKSVKVLQTFNAGLDNPIYAKISARGTRVVNSSAQGVAISEYVMAQVLNLVHPVDRQRDQQSTKNWQITPFRELSRMNWLIIGYGPIGQAIAKRVKAFGATTTIIRRSPQISEFVDKAGTMAQLGAYLPDADVIVIACSLTEDTRGFADQGFFAALKQDALLVNIARGALIDDAAMIAALDSGRLAHAVLDVFHTEPLPQDDPLWSHPQVRITPHTSFAGNGVQGRWDQLFLDNLSRFVNDETLLSEVNPKDIT
jgi:phosphoglycerate dehydrogenase-like enzyme